MRDKNNILLINPWIYDFACYDFWLKPLGLLCLARLLREKGYDISFIDCLDIYNPNIKEEAGKRAPKRKMYGCGQFHKENIDKPEQLRCIPRRYSRYGIPEEAFKRELSRIQKPDAILITSMMTYWYPGPFRAIELSKETFPGVPVILGGIYATLCYEHAKRYSFADYVIKRNGIKEALRLVHSLTNHESREEDTEKNYLYGYPRFDLLRGIDYVCLLTSQGCPYNCHYCASSLLNPSFSLRDPIETVDEIEYWFKKRGIRDFAFYDDALLWHSEEHIVCILNEILKRNIMCNLHAPNGLHMRELTPRIASLMYRAGFKTMRWGFETSDVNHQLLSSGKTTNEELKQAVSYLKEAGFSQNDIGIYILAGLPYQGKEEVEETISFVLECGARPVITEYSPIPGTRLWQDAVEVSKFPIADEPLFHNNSIVPCQWGGFSYDDMNLLKLKTKNLSLA